MVRFLDLCLCRRGREAEDAVGTVVGIHCGSYEVSTISDMKTFYSSDVGWEVRTWEWRGPSDWLCMRVEVRPYVEWRTPSKTKNSTNAMYNQISQDRNHP
jgi:hypothetical protein